MVGKERWDVKGREGGTELRSRRSTERRRSNERKRQGTESKGEERDSSRWTWGREVRGKGAGGKRRMAQRIRQERGKNAMGSTEGTEDNRGRGKKSSRWR